LFLGTIDDNVADRDQKGRTAHGAKIGKLTEDAVKAIISQYASGGITQRELSRKYGISRAQISHIVNRKYWKALHDSGLLAMARLQPHSAYPEEA
jgi:DNA invertase Pin-like site-specific DNA recombinase